MNSTERVLAIGIDAAESTVVRTLMDAGKMPALAALVQEGAWRRVVSPSHIGSGSVWPTFISGTDPTRHGVYAEWAWQPGTMSVKRYSGDELVPFWRSLVDDGVTVGMLDVPFAPFLRMREGFEVCEWGPHDAFTGHVTAGPERIAALVTERPAHPFYSRPVDPAGPHDTQALAELLSGCLDGVRARGEMLRTLMKAVTPGLTLAVFNEIHHASHYLWHAFAPQHPLYTGLPVTSHESIRRGLVTLYEEVDRQIGAVVDDGSNSGTAVMVFSLHGMRPATGVASFLAPLLLERGFARLTGWHDKTWRERAFAAFATIKRHSPPALKKLYYRTLPASTIRQLARPTMLPAYDWARTRAFALPTDQHGWIRVNLRGREARGIVAESDYNPLLDELTSLVESLIDEQGRSLVERTIRTSASADVAVGSALPDLVVHWTDAALARSLRIRGSRVQASSIGQKFTSQHALDGFCVTRGMRLSDGDTIADADLCRVITTSLRSTHPADA